MLAGRPTRKIFLKIKNPLLRIDENIDWLCFADDFRICRHSGGKWDIGGLFHALHNSRKFQPWSTLRNNAFTTLRGWFADTIPLNIRGIIWLSHFFDDGIIARTKLRLIEMPELLRSPE
jgi:hypothetical protein